MQGLKHNAFPLRLGMRDRLAARLGGGPFFFDSTFPGQARMARIPSRKFAKIKKKIPSRKFPKSQRKIPSGKIATGTASGARKPSKASAKRAVPPRTQRLTDEKSPKDRLATLKGELKSLRLASEL